MIYTVDGNSVNARTDWMHQPIPRVPQTSRKGMFPGVAELFVIADVAMPGGHRVFGSLQSVSSSIAAAASGLHTQVNDWSVKRSTRTLHTLVIHGTPMTNAYLDQFEILGRITPFKSAAVPDGQYGLLLPVMFVWMTLK